MVLRDRDLSFDPTVTEFYNTYKCIRIMSNFKSPSLVYDQFLVYYMDVTLLYVHMVSKIRVESALNVYNRYPQI